VTTPFVSIGVPTYNRVSLLRHTLTSLQRQSFTDFEVLVGNDDVREQLSAAGLGISDARFSVVNHERNLGEIRNMNALLGLARGSYFTWQFDDDFYATNFLAEMHAAITSHRAPPVVFSGFRTHYGLGEPRYRPAVAGDAAVSELDGATFLADVFGGRRRAMGACGVYERAYLASIGGIRDISGEAVGLYSEHLLLLTAGLGERVVHVNAPLVSYRDQDASWSGRNLNVELYVTTGLTLMRELVRLANQGAYGRRLGDIAAGVLAMTVDDIVSRMVARDGRVAGPQLAEYVAAVEREFAAIEPAAARRAVAGAVERVRRRRPAAAIVKGWVKRSPPWVQHVVRGIRARLS